MKGLLYKDFLALWKMRLLAVYIPVVMIVPLSSEQNMFMMLLPCMFAATLPMNLLSLDEKSHWDTYSQALPVTRAQLVHAKYILCICLVVAFSFLAMLSKTAMMAFAGELLFLDVFGLFSMMISVGIMINAVMMPFVFRFGMEKGSMVYYAVLALCGVGTGIFYGINGLDYTGGMRISPLMTILLLAASLVAFAISCHLSVRIYTKREL